MTIDIKALMGAFDQDTNAIGVVKVEVRSAFRDGSIKLQGKKYKLKLQKYSQLYRHGRFLCYIILKYTTQKEFFQYSCLDQ